jgi:phosphatidate cytidylyltransferase
MLRQRIITALLLAPFLAWVVIWAPSTVAIATFAGVTLLGAWEWSQFCGLKTVLTRIRYVLLICACLFLAWKYSGNVRVLQWMFLAALLWWVCALLWILFAPERGHVWLAALAGIPVLVPTFVALSQIRLLNKGAAFTLFLLLLIFAADIGAYFAGRQFGKLKLAPKVSPGKTWEGAIGGMIASAIVAIIGAVYFKLDITVFVGLCMAVAMISIVGDLTESMFKRHVGLKDSSNLLPGHGGILDRIDSITAASPVFALGLMWMSVLR